MVCRRKFTFLDERKQARTQWLQDLYKSNIDNLNNVRREASRHFRNTNKKYLKARIEELEINGKKKSILHTCIGVSVTSRRVTRL